MCASTLEYNSGMATANIEEMLKADISENAVVVIETGGTKKWRGYDIPANKICRYVVEDGTLVLKEMLENANMGRSSTLVNFLNYCNNNYPAEQTGLIFWNHGSGSINGVCFDQNYEMDSLTLTEIETSLFETNTHLNMVGFDACLMATYDMANMLSEYSDYMLASEEIEPGEGWDYTTFLQSLTDNNDMKRIGEAICDSYLEKCRNNETSGIATLSLADLSKMNTVRETFGDFVDNLKKQSEEKDGNFETLTAINASVKFGGNSKIEGYSNLIDLYNFADELKYLNSTALKMINAIDDMIIYKVNGESRMGAGGISLYYPSVYDNKQIKSYLTICQSKEYGNYLNFLYTNLPSETISFEDKGSIAEDGSFQIKLTTDSKKYIKSIEFYLIEFAKSENEENFPKINGLGIDNDIYNDYDSMTFHSNFRGIWLALDGKTLSYSVVESNSERIIFSAPVIVNNQITNLRFSFIWDDSYENGGYYEIIGLWDGISSEEIVSKEIKPLKSGDVITVLSRQIDQGDYLTSLRKKETFIIGEDDGVISEVPLSQQYYQYVYAVTDIFGNVFYSHTAMFEMQFTYDELISNPLSDGEYAAKIDVISDDVDNQLAYGESFS